VPPIPKEEEEEEEKKRRKYIRFVSLSLSFSIYRSVPISQSLSRAHNVLSCARENEPMID
jgi:hypothetical protein